MQKLKKVILIGRIASGKTTLCQYICNKELTYNKTQTVEVINDFLIDTPGEYLERRQMRGALMVTSADADVIIFIQDASERGTMFPPAYCGNFAKPCIGVVTKSDLASQKDIEEAKQFLKMAGALKIFVTSSSKGTGFEELVEYLSLS